MIKGYRIIDADGHVIEPSDLWEKHLPADLAAIAPRRKGERHVECGGEPQQPSRFVEEPGADVLRHNSDTLGHELIKRIPSAAAV